MKLHYQKKKKRENVRLFLLRIFTKIQEYIEKEKLEI